MCMNRRRPNQRMRWCTRVACIVPQPSAAPKHPTAQKQKRGPTQQEIIMNKASSATAHTCTRSRRQKPPRPLAPPSAHPRGHNLRDVYADAISCNGQKVVGRPRSAASRGGGIHSGAHAQRTSGSCTPQPALTAALSARPGCRARAGRSPTRRCIAAWAPRVTPPPNTQSASTCRPTHTPYVWRHHRRTRPSPCLCRISSTSAPGKRQCQEKSTPPHSRDVLQLRPCGTMCPSAPLHPPSPGPQARALTRAHAGTCTLICIHQLAHGQRRTKPPHQPDLATAATPPVRSRGTPSHSISMTSPHRRRVSAYCCISQQLDMPRAARADRRNCRPSPQLLSKPPLKLPLVSSYIPNGRLPRKLPGTFFGACMRSAHNYMRVADVSVLPPQGLPSGQGKSTRYVPYGLPLTSDTRTSNVRPLPEAVR